MNSKAPTRQLLETFDKLHLGKCGVRAVIQGGKDAKLLAGIWKTHGTDCVVQLMVDYFASRDPFILTSGYSVGRFIGQAPKLIALSQRPATSVFDWWDECKRAHGGTCSDRYRHGLKMRD